MCGCPHPGALPEAAAVQGEKRGRQGSPLPVSLGRDAGTLAGAAHGTEWTSSPRAVSSFRELAGYSEGGDAVHPHLRLPPPPPVGTTRPCTQAAVPNLHLQAAATPGQAGAQGPSSLSRLLSPSTQPLRKSDVRALGRSGGPRGRGGTRAARAHVLAAEYSQVRRSFA